MARKVVYKTYQQHQLSLLPPSLDELIPAGHPVRIVNSVIDQIDISIIEKEYKAGGCSSYHPRMLLKVMVYAYMENMYSSRGMERLLKENINYMWLSGMSKPDHNTINRFRCEKLKDSLETIFHHVVELMIEQGVVSLKQAFVDGTKFEANANRYSFVWGKAITKNKARIAQQLKELWSYTQRIAQEELQEPEPPDFEPTDPAKVKETIEKIDRALRGSSQVDNKVKQKVNYAKRNWPSNLEKYNKQEMLLQGRNSMSKTDADATFMRMKEDHMQNGQLKPGYNVQLSTNDQYILCYSVHQHTNDFNALPEHLDRFQRMHGRLPKEVIADAGYGSEENYNLLENKDIVAYVKYPQFDREINNEIGEFDSSRLHYNKEKDCFYCPMGQAIAKRKQYTEQKTGKQITIYQASNCNGCPMRGVCHSSKENRTIKISHELLRHRKKARELLTSEKGQELRKKRSIDVEPTFGHIKHNKKFKRFNLRGIKKVDIEIGLVAIAQNLKKMAA
jgi:transposase